MVRLANYRIAILPGDGIGPEVMGATKSVLDTLSEKTGLCFEYVELEVGDRMKKKTGVAMQSGTIDEVARSDAALFAAVGETAKEVILPLRQKLELYANVRPVKRARETRTK